MAFEAWSVSTVWRFQSNAGQILPYVTRQVLKTTAATDEMSASVDQVSISLRGMANLVRGVVSSMRQLGVGVAALSDEFDALAKSSMVATAKIMAGMDGVADQTKITGDVATREARRFALSQDVMADAAADASMSVTKSATNMNRRLGLITASANRASAAMVGLKGASGGGGGFASGGGRGGFGGGGAGAAAAGAGARGAGGFGLGDAIGLGALAATATGVRGAANLQDSVVQTAVNQGMSNQDASNKFVPVAMRMSMNTAQSVGDSMNMLRVMSSAGLPLSSMKGQNLSDFAMAVARYADINFLQTGHKHLDFETSAQLMAGISHDLQIYDPKQMAGLADMLYRAGGQSVHGPQQMLTQMRQYAPRFRAAGISTEDIVNMYPLLDRFGLGTGRGGSGLNMIMKNIQDPRGAKKQAALEMMGIYDAKGNNRFIDSASGDVNFTGFLQYVSDWRAKMKLNKKGALANLLESRGFDTNASNVLETMATPGGMQQLQRIRTAESKMKPLTDAQARYMMTLNHQTQLLSTNFQTLMTQAIQPLIPPLTSFVAALAQATGNLAMFLSGHPMAQKVAAGALAVGSVAGISSLIKMFGGIIPFFSHHVGHHASTSVGVAMHGGGRHGHIGGGGAVARNLGRFGLKGGSLFEGLMDLLSLAPMGRALKGGVTIAKDAGIVGKIVRGTGVASGLGPLMKGALSAMPWISRLGQALLNAGAGAKLFGGLAGVAAKGLGFLAGGLFKFGLRAIPVVGNILMIIDVLKLLGSHSHDIGYMIGEAVRWIRTEGFKMFLNAIKDMITFGLQSLGGLFNGGHGGIWDIIQSGIRGFNAGNDPQNNKVLPGQVQPMNGLPAASGGPQSVIYVGGHMYVNTPDAKSLPQAARGAALQQHTFAASRGGGGGARTPSINMTPSGLASGT